MNIPPAGAPPTPSTPVEPLPPGNEDAGALIEDFAEILKRRKSMPRETPGRTPKPAGPTVAPPMHPPPRNGEPIVPGHAGRKSREGEMQGDTPMEIGLGLAGQNGTPVTITVTAAPQPHVDPGGFAELMARLWLRAQEQRTREVRVQFGSDAWPATGARLIRAADGTLDVAVLVADHGAAVVDARLGVLHERLQARGLAIGALGVEPV